MRARISRTYTLQCAHFLPRVAEGHKCGRLHGHTYTITVTLCDEVVDGFVIDFAIVDEHWKALVFGVLDHTLLNDTIENPTSENLAAWVLDRLMLAPFGGIVESVRVCENERSSAEVWT